MLSTTAASRKDRTSGLGALQHRHFATIATIIREMDKVSNQEHGFIDIREDVAEHFADLLGKTNPNFDRERFLRACKDGA